MSVRGVKLVLRNLSNFRTKTLNKIVRGVQITQALVVNEAKNHHPYDDQTQALTNSIRPARIVITDTSIEAKVAALMQYASFVEFGTSRSRPFPFLAPAILKNQSQFRKQMIRAMRP